MEQNKSIIRVQKSANYSIISNHPLNNPDLSFKAKGLLTYLLSKPDNWVISISHLAKVSTDQIASVRSAVKELRKNGYMTLSVSRENGKIQQWIYTAHELPQLSENIEREPDTDFQQVAFQQVENQRVLNTDRYQKRIKEKTERAPTSQKSEKKAGLGIELIPGYQIPESERAFISQSIQDYGLERVKTAFKSALERKASNPFAYTRKTLTAGYQTAEKHNQSISSGVYKPFTPPEKPDNILSPAEIVRLCQERKNNRRARSSSDLKPINSIVRC